MAEWLSSRCLLQQPGLSLVWILGADLVPLIRPCWGGVPHSTTRGTLTTRIYNCVLGGLWGEEEEEKKKKKIGNSC